MDLVTVSPIWLSGGCNIMLITLIPSNLDVIEHEGSTFHGATMVNVVHDNGARGEIFRL